MIGGQLMSPSPNARYESGVGINMPGRLGQERPVGGWPNLVEVANLSIGHFNEIADPNFNYMAYVGGRSA